MNDNYITLDNHIFNYIKINKFNKSKLLKDLKNNNFNFIMNQKIPMNLSFFQFFPNKEYVKNLSVEIQNNIFNNDKINIPLLHEIFFKITNDNKIETFHCDHFPLLLHVFQCFKKKKFTQEELIKFSNFVTLSLIPEIKELLSLTSDRNSFIHKLSKSLLYIQYEEENIDYPLSKIIMNAIYDNNIIEGKDIFKMTNLKYLLNNKKILSLVKYYEAKDFNDYFRNSYTEIFFNALTSFTYQDNIVSYITNELNINFSEIQEKIIYPVIFAKDKTSKYFYEAFKKIYYFNNEYKNTIHINNNTRPSALNLLQQLSFLIIQKDENKNIFNVNHIYPLLKNIGFYPNYDEISVNMKMGMNKAYKKHSSLLLNEFYPNKKEQIQLLNNLIINLFKRQSSNITDPSVYSLDFYDYFNISSFNNDEYHSLLDVFRQYSFFDEDRTRFPFIENEISKLFDKDFIRTEKQNLLWMEKNHFNPVSFIHSFHLLQKIYDSAINNKKHLLTLILNDSLQFNHHMELKNTFLEYEEYNTATQSFINRRLVPFIIALQDTVFNIYQNNKTPHIYRFLLLSEDILTDYNKSLLIEHFNKTNIIINENDISFIKDNYIKKLKEPLFISFFENLILSSFIPSDKNITIKKRL